MPTFRDVTISSSAVVLAIALQLQPVPALEPTVSQRLARSLQMTDGQPDSLELATIPSVITISGLVCTPTANAQYLLQPKLLNDKPHWMTADGNWHLYWSPYAEGGYIDWMIGPDTDNSGRNAVAMADSEAELPMSAEQWHAGSSQTACDSGINDISNCCSWTPAVVSLNALLTATNCAALPAAILAQPACDGVAEHVAASIKDPSGSSNHLLCPRRCAELWLESRNRCSMETESFDSAAPAGLTRACDAAAVAAATDAPVLITAPRSIAVGGMTCHPAANDEYVLQPFPVNGRPHYATVNGGQHIFWTPREQGMQSWLISDRLDSSKYEAIIISPADIPPVGSVVWQEGCSPGHGNTDVRLQLSPRYREANSCSMALNMLKPRLLDTCCALEDGVDCGTNGVLPSTCSLDCARLWQPYANQCHVAFSDTDDAHLVAFFDRACNAEEVPLTVVNETAMLQSRQSHNFAFEARSGTRYQLDVRVLEGSRKLVPCRSNAYDLQVGEGQCDDIISTRSNSPDPCAMEFCADCGEFAHTCDASCGFLCPDTGVTITSILILPPGATDSSQAMVTQMDDAADKGIAFTAPATGAFTAVLQAYEGSGPVAVTIMAVGTALGRSPELQTDGLPHNLFVNCTFAQCSFDYDGLPYAGVPDDIHSPIDTGSVVIDTDGNAFDLVLPNAEAGRAYAVRIDLPPGERFYWNNVGAQVTATFYMADAAAGEAGFDPVVTGPIGQWRATPPPSPCSTDSRDDCFDVITQGLSFGISDPCTSAFCPDCEYPHTCDNFCNFICDHESIFEYSDCGIQDRQCFATIMGIPSSFGIHPGGKFNQFLEGTWISPVSGAVLLRLEANCDVPFFADVQADGCYIYNDHGGDTFGCDATYGNADTHNDIFYNSECASQLLVTVAPGAYYDDDPEHGAHRRMQTGGDYLHQTVEPHAPTHGTVQRTDRIVVPRTEVESQAAAAWRVTPTAQRQLAAPPSLDDMLVIDTPANALLVSLFTVREQPHVVYPLGYVLGSDGDDCDHRRLQTGGDRLHVTIDTHAPSPVDANAAEQHLISRVSGAELVADCVPPEIQEHDRCDVVAGVQAVQHECCDEPGEDCSSGTPASCNVGCAQVTLPFFDHCSGALGDALPNFGSLVEMCQVALDGHRRRAQMGGDHLNNPIDIHVCGLGSSDAGCTAAGQTRRQTRLIISRDDVEAQAAVLWQAEQVFAGRRLQSDGGQLHAPSLDEMLVTGTQANALLSRLFINEQPPQLAYPTGWMLNSTVGRNRRLQTGGDHLVVTIETHAATPATARQTVQRLVPPTGFMLDETFDSPSLSGESEHSSNKAPCTVTSCQNGGTCTESTAVYQAGDGYGYGSGEKCADLSARTAVVNGQCCDKLAKDCSSGMPTKCNVDCVVVLAAYLQDCRDALEDIPDLLSIVQSALDSCPSIPRYQCMCASGWSGDTCEVRN